MRVKKIGPINLFHFSFKNQIDLTMSFLRMQEYYESPKFRGKKFTLDEYIRWYCTEGGKSKKSKKPVVKEFDYVVEVAGHNVPGDWCRDFQHDFSGDLTPQEEAIFEEIEDRVDDESCDFYLIGTTDCIPNLAGYLAHEIRHALFYLIPEYKRDILRVIRQFPCKTFRKKLLGKSSDEGYNRAVLNDEIQAYALTGYDPYYECNIGELPLELQNLRRELKKVEREYITKGKIHVPA